MLFNSKQNNIGILLCTDNYLRIGAEQISGIERIAVTLVTILKKTGCHFFNAFKQTDDGSRISDLDDYYFSPYEKIQVEKETSVDTVAKFVIENEIVAIHLLQAETRDFLFYHLVAERTGCRLIYSMLEKPFSDLFKYQLSYNFDCLYRVPWAKKFHYLVNIFSSKINAQVRYRKLQKKNAQCLKYCDKIVLQSELYIPTLEKLLQQQLSLKKIKLLPNCVPYPDFFKEENIPILKQKEVIVLSNLEEATSQISVIINIWKELHNKFRGWTLRILGDGPDSNFYKKMIKPKYNIILEGRQDPILFYQTASIYINMGISTKSFSSSLLEAMQNAVIPIVLNSNEIYSSIIENEVNGYIVNDKNNFKTSLERLMSNPEQCLKMAKKSLSKSKQYGQRSFAMGYYDLYHS